MPRPRATRSTGSHRATGSATEQNAPPAQKRAASAPSARRVLTACFRIQGG